MKTKNFTNLIGLMLCGSLAFAQPKQNASPQANVFKPEMHKDIQQAITGYVNAMNSIFINNRDRSIEPLVKCLDEDYHSTNYVVDIGGYTKRNSRDLNDYRAQVAALIDINGLAIHHKIESISFIHAYDGFAIASFSMTRVALLNEDSLMRIRVFETVYLKKKNDRWVICEENIASVHKEQTMGLCPCRFEKQKDGQSIYKADLLVPDGFGFIKTQANFEFSGTNTGIKVIKVNNDAYTWDPKGSITCVRKESADVSEVIPGTATTEYKAMEAILVNHLYGRQCVGLSAMPAR